MRIDYPKSVLESIVIDRIRFDNPFQTKRMNGADPKLGGINSKIFDALMNLVRSPVCVCDCNNPFVIVRL